MFKLNVALETIHRRTLESYKMVHNIYGSPSYIFLNNKVAVVKYAVPQGCLLAGSVFNLALSSIFEELEVTARGYQGWYMDDYLFLGPPDEIEKIRKCINIITPKVGCYPNINL